MNRETDFIGRVPELTRLADLLEAAYTFKPSVVFLGGDAGVGKTRLLDEFVRWARQDDDRVFVLRGDCMDLSEQARIPYGPLVWALRGFLREHGERARELAGPGWTKLGGLIAEFSDDPPTRPREERGPLTADVVFEAVRQMLMFLGLKKPVALIFEDLQWADQSTLDLVSYLAQRLTDQRVVLVCSHRTGLERGHPLRSRLAEPKISRSSTAMDLPPFTEEECWAFLGSVGRMNQDQLRLGYELSEGNAFFAEELWHSGVLRDPDAGRVPGSVQELMLTRLDRLTEPADRLLGYAAIAARRVDARLLEAVCGLSDDSLENALDECVAQGILMPDQENEDAFVFRHALLRETVYDRQSKPNRRRRHAAMAEAISRNAALGLDEDASLAVEISHHWFHAGRRPEALIAALRAAAVTARLGAYPEAETHYRRALELWPRVEAPEDLVGVPRARVLSEAADTARWAGHVALAVEFVGAAIAEVGEVERPRRTGELYERLGSYLWEAGDAEGSAQAYAQARRMLALEPPSGPVDVLVLCGLSGVAARSGGYTEALRLAEEAIALAEAVEATAERGRALNTAGVACTMLGRAEEGVASLRQALEIAQRAGHREDVFRAYGNLGFALEYAGDLGEAADVALEGLAEARTHGIVYARQADLLANNAAVALVLLGRWDEAVDLLDRALLDNPPIGESAYLRLSRAEIDVARGQFEEAERLLTEIDGQRPTDPRFVGALRACAVELDLWRGLPKQALGKAVGALTALEGGENAVEQLRLCALGLRAAADLSERGRADQAVEDQAAELAERAEGCAERQSPALPELPALLRQCEAEYDRAQGYEKPAAWDGVAGAWEELKRPGAAAYARWRQAAALRAEGAVDEAARITRETLERIIGLGARPLEDALAGPAELPPMPLSPKQLEVARLVARSMGNAAIGAELGIETGTVARHVHEAMKKLRAQGLPVENRTGLAMYVHDNDLLDEASSAEDGGPP
jgi:tetratricopeptide (TPR) repeat protein/DNA-binding CsgD family transcriptional regulator